MAARDDFFRDFPKKRKPALAVVNGGGNGSVAPPIWINGQELADKVFPPIRWVVPGILPEGFSLLAGKVKLGKSWLLMNIGIAVGLGGMALSAIVCPEGDVLYLALEDTERRLKERQESLCSEGFRPKRVGWATSWPRLDQGAIGFIEQWIAGVENPRLVVVDTIKMIRPPKARDEGIYDYDYASVLPLRELANKHKLAIVGVHHLNKRNDADDPFDLISGSNGLAACADTVYIMNRKGEHTTLYGRGRDVCEFDKALTFGANNLWQLLGDADVVATTNERANIQAFLANNHTDASVSDISASLGISASKVRFLLWKMVRDGQATRTERGRYGAPESLQYKYRKHANNTNNTNKQ